MTLIKLRQNFPESDLGNRFCVSQSTVSRIFSVWVLCLHSTFKEIPISPFWQLVDKFLPCSFREKYPTTCIIIDATEVRLEQRVKTDVQAAAFSNYKNTYTFKLLVGVTPNDVYSFLSPLLGGHISEKEMLVNLGNPICWAMETPLWLTGALTVRASCQKVFVLTSLHFLAPAYNSTKQTLLPHVVSQACAIMSSVQLSD